MLISGCDVGHLVGGPHVLQLENGGDRRRSNDDERALRMRRLGQGRIRTYVARSAAGLQPATINHSVTCP
jgi:hypothetical protein